MDDDKLPDELLPWERRPDESQKAYAAFCAYRDMRPNRSLRQAYRRQTGHEHATSLPRQWGEWCARFKWRERIEAYDVHIERAIRQEKEAVYRSDLEQFRKRQKQLAQSSLNIATTLLVRAGTRLNAMSEEETKTMEIRLLPAFVRAAAAIAQSATDSEAQALAVAELLKMLDGMGVDGD